MSLRDVEGFMLAMLTVSEHRQMRRDTLATGGKIEGIALPAHADFAALRLTSANCVRQFAQARLAQSCGLAGASAHTSRTARVLFEERDRKPVQSTPASTAGGDLVSLRLFRLDPQLSGSAQSLSGRQLAIASLQRPAAPQDLMLRAIVVCNYGCTALIAGVHPNQRTNAGTVKTW